MTLGCLAADLSQSSLCLAAYLSSWINLPLPPLAVYFLLWCLVRRTRAQKTTDVSKLSSSSTQSCLLSTLISLNVVLSFLVHLTFTANHSPFLGQADACRPSIQISPNVFIFCYADVLGYLIRDSGSVQLHGLSFYDLMPHNQHHYLVFNNDNQFFFFKLLAFCCCFSFAQLIFFWIVFCILIGTINSSINVLISFSFDQFFSSLKPLFSSSKSCPELLTVALNLFHVVRITKIKLRFFPYLIWKSPFRHVVWPSLPLVSTLSFLFHHNLCYFGQIWSTPFFSILKSLDSFFTLIGAADSC